MADEFANLLNENQQATPGPGAQPSFADFFKQYQKANPVKQDPFQNVYYDPQQVNRYKESPIYTPWIDPFADNETMAAQAQTGWEALWNGTKGSWDGIKDGFVSSAMVLPNLIGSLFTGSIEGMMDDEYGMQMSAYEQQQNQNENPIYMTESERDDIFSMKAAGEMMQNAGYTIGTFAELATETVALEFLAGAFTVATGGAGAETLAATTALETGRWGKFLNSFRKAGQATGEAFNTFRFGTRTAEMAAQDALRARSVAQQAEIIAQMGKLHDAQFGTKLGEKLFNLSTKIPVVGELIETGNVMRLANKTGLVGAGDLARIGAGGIRRAYGEFQAASGEAAIEAGGTYNDVYNSIYDDFVKENGYEPSADEDARMRELAKSAAVDSYGLNMGTLLLMNKIEFGNLFRHMNADNAIVRAFRNDALDAFTVTGRVGGKLKSKAYTKGTFGRLGILPDVIQTFDNGYRVAAAQFGKGLVSGFRQFSVWEGLQENIQEGIVHGLKKHYSDLYNNDPSTWGEGFQEAVDSQMNKQGLKTFMMGAMTGVVTGPLITRTSKAIGYFGNREGYRSQQEETKKTVEAFNAFMSNHSKVLSEHIRKTKESNAYGEEMQRAAATDDQFNYLNSRESALMQAVHSAKRLGNLPLLMNTVKAYGQGFDNQAFKEAFGFSPEEAGYSSASEFTSRIANDIKRYSDTYDNYMKKYSNFMDIGKYIKDPHRKLVSDITRAALIDAIETVSFHESKAQDAVKRRAGIQSKIASYQTIGEALQTGFGQLTNLDEIQNERDVLQNEIQSLESVEIKDKETDRLIKVKKEQLNALLDWMDAIGYKMDENTRKYSYDNVAIRRKNSPDRYKASDAFKRYLGARNAGLKRNQVVKQEEVDAAMQDVVDFMELGEENRKMVEALNMLNDPNGFAKTFQAAQNARIGAHARNVANVARMLAELDPAFAKLLEENEMTVKELEQFAEAPFGNNANWEYLAKLQNKLKNLLKQKQDKVNNPETKPKSEAEKTETETSSNNNENNPGQTAILDPENLQAMLDRGQGADVMSFVNKHYIFKQISPTRYSYQRVLDSRVPEPVVTHEGEFDITDQDSLEFAVAFETALFKKQAGNNPVSKTVTKEGLKIKNLVGRMFTIDSDQAVLEEDADGYYFQIFNPLTGETIANVFLGDDGEMSYRKFKHNGERFTLIKDSSDPVDSEGGQVSTTPGSAETASINTEIQNIEDKKEEAIRDEKQKLQWHEGKRVMYNGEAGKIIETKAGISSKDTFDTKENELETLELLHKSEWHEAGVYVDPDTPKNAEKPLWKVGVSKFNSKVGENGGMLYSETLSQGGFQSEAEALAYLKEVEEKLKIKEKIEAKYAERESEYAVQLDNGSVITLGPGESLLDEYPGLTAVAQGQTSVADNVPVEDRVFAIDFVSDDRSVVKIDGKQYVIIRNAETGEISGLQYETKSGPRVGRNGIFQQYINAITTSYPEMSEALAAEDQEALNNDIKDIEANSLEVQTVEQMVEQIASDLFFRFFVQDEQLSPEEANALRNSLMNAVTLKNESTVQGPLMDQFEQTTLSNLNILNAKYPPDDKPQETASGSKSPKQAKRRGKTQSQKSNDDASASTGQKTKSPRKSKNKPTSLQESIEQLELDFDDQKKEVRLSTENPNVQSVQSVEQYATTLDTLVNDMLANPDEFSGLLNFVESSIETTKKSTKNSKFVIGSTDSEIDTNPFASLGEGITCNK